MDVRSVTPIVSGCIKILPTFDLAAASAMLRFANAGLWKSTFGLMSDGCDMFGKGMLTSAYFRRLPTSKPYSSWV